MENLEEDNNKNVSMSLIAEYGASDSDSDDTDTLSNENYENEDSDNAELSEMVLKNNLINACAHGPLSRPSEEIEDHGRQMIIDSLENGVVEYEVTEYRDIESDSDTDSDVDSVKDIEEQSSSDEAAPKSENTPIEDKIEPPRVLGELDLDDLPPIEDLAISLPAQETTKIGTIASIVDRLVIVRALPNTPPVDLDSVLFLDNGAKALGKVFDVFGPVSEPHYCVRFNSVEHVRARGAEPGHDVYIAPRTPHTQYVFLEQLMNVKGSDASWLNDVEPPPGQLEYSDDEEERRAKRKDKTKNNDSENGEASVTNQPRKNQEGRKNQRPSDSSSRFGSGPSRGRNPFSAGSRRSNTNPFPRFSRPWSHSTVPRTPPAHPNDPGGPYSAPPFPPGAPMFHHHFNPHTPPPFMGNPFQFGGNPRMHGVPMGPPPFRHNGPVFGSNYCIAPGPRPQWVNNAPPPPPGT